MDQLSVIISAGLLASLPAHLLAASSESDKNRFGITDPAHKEYPHCNFPAVLGWNTILVIEPDTHPNGTLLHHWKCQWEVKTVEAPAFWIQIIKMDLKALPVDSFGLHYRHQYCPVNQHHFCSHDCHDEGVYILPANLTYARNNHEEGLVLCGRWDKTATTFFRIPWSHGKIYFYPKKYAYGDAGGGNVFKIQLSLCPRREIEHGRLTVHSRRYMTVECDDPFVPDPARLTSFHCHSDPPESVMPRCILAKDAKARGCPPVHIPNERLALERATVIGSLFPEGSKRTVRCFTGYGLIGKADLVCADAAWANSDGKLPACVPEEYITKAESGAGWIAVFWLLLVANLLGLAFIFLRRKNLLPKIPVIPGIPNLNYGS